MKDDRQIPNKPRVNIELPTEFGGRKIQQLDIQGNRTLANEDFNWYLLNQLAVPSRVVDIMADILLWLATCSFLASISKHCIKLAAVWGTVTVISAIAVFLSFYILKIAPLPKVRLSLAYRWFLIFIGVYLGVR